MKHVLITGLNMVLNVSGEVLPMTLLYCYGRHYDLVISSNYPLATGERSESNKTINLKETKVSSPAPVISNEPVSYNNSGDVQNEQPVKAKIIEKRSAPKPQQK